MCTSADLKEELFCLLREKGAKLIGIADLKGVVEGGLKTGISVAVPVPKHIVRDLQHAPTKEYYDAYYSLNEELDHIVSCGADFIKERGYQAFANTTKVVRMDDDWRTPLPHKTVATRAGIGWIGKNCLLVTREYGSAIRLSSLLTDAPLPTAQPITKSFCGNCNVCVKSCPGKALTGIAWDTQTSRAELFHKEACKKTQLQRMKQATGLEKDLCGLCFAVCTYTKRYLNEN
ncbi:MAG: epoxyqueuosine reductase [Dorea sp.]|jgi:epoxyqueuosine reductase|nr:epoxyqueuosine reductase [Dorea sp.]